MSAQMFCRSEGTNRSLKGGKVDDVTDSETNIEILTKPKITSKKGKNEKWSFRAKLPNIGICTGKQLSITLVEPV